MKLALFALFVLVVASSAHGQSAGFAPGIQWRYFEGDWAELPDLDGMRPLFAGRTDSISLDRSRRTDGFALRFEGVIIVPRRGVYRPQVDADDGCRLSIGGETVVEGSGTGELVLDPGRHSFRLDYFEASGPEHLTVRIDGPFAIIDGASRGPGVELAPWFGEPAEEWRSALPIGNGRMGAMVFGGADGERLQLGEDSMWPGAPGDRHRRGSAQDLARWRGLLFDGRHAEVDGEVMGAFSGGVIQRSHQAVGDLFWSIHDHREVRDYARWLDLGLGVAVVTYECDGVRHRREFIASKPHEVIAIRLSAAAPGRVGFDLGLSRPDDAGKPTVRVDVDADRRRVVMDGVVSQNVAPVAAGVTGSRFRVVAHVDAVNADVAEIDGALRVRGADAATIWVVVNTEFYGADYLARTERQLRAARRAGWDDVRDAHTADHEALFGRVGLHLGEPSAIAHASMSERLAAVRSGSDDPALTALMFQFARYLLIASSREGSLPPNRRGLWNDELLAPDNCAYGLAGHLQMNYWPAEVANLAELNAPLFAFTERLAASGAVRAKENFGCRGWVTAHTTDAFAETFHRSDRPEIGFWHHGGAWLLRHYAEHWRFSGDERFLRDKAWPLMKGACEFYLDWLVPHALSGELVSGPSTSPGNRFVPETVPQAVVCMGPALDHQIISELFRDTLDAAAILGIDDDFVREVRDTRDRLADPISVGADGRILEYYDEVREVDPGHEHLAHLYALYPSDAIDPERTSRLARAARKTLEARVRNGCGSVGWSRAWLVALTARLGDGDGAHGHALALTRDLLADNLFALGPDFRIDGNLGFAAGVAEMLIQSHGGEVEVLPALPTAWSEGAFRGLRARGGFELDLVWSRGRWTTMTVRSRRGAPFVLRYGGEVSVVASEGRDVPVRSEAGRVRFETEAGAEYLITH